VLPRIALFCRQKFSGRRKDREKFSRLAHRRLICGYRELVLPKEAELYWNIAPAAEAKNLVTFANV
jgi:hypothetical protein